MYRIWLQGYITVGCSIVFNSLQDMIVGCSKVFFISVTKMTAGICIYMYITLWTALVFFCGRFCMDVYSGIKFTFVGRFLKNRKFPQDSFPLRAGHAATLPRQRDHWDTEAFTFFVFFLVTEVLLHRCVIVGTLFMSRSYKIVACPALFQLVPPLP